MFDVNKALQIISFFAFKENSNGQIKYIKILKLLFLADKLYLRTYGKTISGDSYVAMKRWPVASNTFNVIKEPERFWELEDAIENTIEVDIKNKTLTAKKEADYNYLSELELKTLEKIYKNFWNYSRNKLVDICHRYDEWAKHKNHIWNSSIPMDFLDFFSEVQEKNSIFEMSEDDISLARDIYKENMAYV